MVTGISCSLKLLVSIDITIATLGMFITVIHVIIHEHPLVPL